MGWAPPRYDNRVLYFTALLSLGNTVFPSLLPPGSPWWMVRMRSTFFLDSNDSRASCPYIYIYIYSKYYLNIHYMFMSVGSPRTKYVDIFVSPNIIFFLNTTKLRLRFRTIKGLPATTRRGRILKLFRGAH